MQARRIQTFDGVPFWARLAISDRLGRRLSRRNAVLRAIFTTVVGDVLIASGSFGYWPIRFLLSCLGAVACFVALYYWVSLGWLEYHHAWKRRV